MNPDRYRIHPDSEVRLSRHDPRDKSLFDGTKEEARAVTAALNARLEELQELLWAEHRHKVLVVLQAMDAGGKDSTIRRVFEGVNPQGVRVTSFKAPSKAELDRDYLWRVHREVPAKGMIRVFNRSHYEDVLIVRVNSLVPESVWQARFEQINQFEKLLAETGTTIVKFYLHLSKEEQKERFEARLSDPTRQWKFSIEDLAKREQWDGYMDAYQDALLRCSTGYAPWYAIPADQKWYRNLAIARVLVSTLEAMDPRYPAAEKGIEKLRVD